MFEVVAQLRLWVTASDEDDAGSVVKEELTAWFDDTAAPEWVVNAVVELKSVKTFGKPGAILRR